MRALFANTLLQYAKNDKNIIVLTGDLGQGMWDQFRDTLPDQFINCGASEQALMDIAVGIALEGKKPFAYTITSFFLRAAETISLYISHERIPVRLVGSGRDDNYKHDGISHHAGTIQKFINSMKNIVCYYPDYKKNIPDMVKGMVENDQPSFISLIR